MKSDEILLADLFEMFMKVSIKYIDDTPLHFVPLPGHTWHCGLKYAILKLQTLQDKDLILILD